MAELTREEVLDRARRGEKLTRLDLRGLDLSGADLSGADLRRSDLSGANLRSALLRGANFRNASLREAYLVGADMREVNLDKAELDSANLDKANLEGANLDRANLEGATMLEANLRKASLSSAELESANLGKADLREANLSHADLSEAYLGGAKLQNADLRGASLPSALLEEADLEGARLDGADLAGARAPRARFVRASLVHADLTGALLREATFEGADLRQADFSEAQLTGALLGGAKVQGATFARADLEGVTAEWLDASPDGDGGRRIAAAQVLDHLLGKITDRPATRRYFGKGDMLRGAQLEFHEGSSVEIESRFEDCAITLGPGSELVVGDDGVLSSCRIHGPGDISVSGAFYEAPEGTKGSEGPSIDGARRIIVRKTGIVVAKVAQAPGGTRFVFEPGSRLRLGIDAAPPLARPDTERAPDGNVEPLAGPPESESVSATTMGEEAVPSTEGSDPDVTSAEVESGGTPTTQAAPEVAVDPGANDSSSDSSPADSQTSDEPARAEDET